MIIGLSKPILDISSRCTAQSRNYINLLCTSEIYHSIESVALNEDRNIEDVAAEILKAGLNAGGQHQDLIPVDISTDEYKAYILIAYVDKRIEAEMKRYQGDSTNTFDGAVLEILCRGLTVLYSISLS